MSQQCINDQETNRHEARLYTSEYGEYPQKRALFGIYGEKVSVEGKK